MTVGELIACLEQFPENKRVKVEISVDGVDFCVDLKETNICDRGDVCLSGVIEKPECYQIGDRGVGNEN